MRFRIICLIFAVIGLFFYCGDGNQAGGEDSMNPSGGDIDINAQGYSDSGIVRVPLITWGADLITVYANGGTLKTSQGSLFQKYNLNMELFREDDFQKQINEYISGKSPYLRGTMGMINMAAESIKQYPELKLVVIFQHSWSAGGDALVVKPGIKAVKDLKGKSIAIQKNGPHLAYCMKLLSDAGLSDKDVNIVWTNDLVGPDGDTPMAKFYKSNIDAAFVIIPDALALTSSGTIGTGAEDSVKGAVILLSTKTANRIISDVYAVRKDYFEKNRDSVKNFVHALFIAEEQVRDLFKNSKSESFKKFITAGAKILLDSSEAGADMAGMFYDAEMSGFQGNVKFFSDKNFLRRFERLNEEIQTSFSRLGIMSGRREVLNANWDYNEFRSGLVYADNVEVPKFEKDTVAAVITKRQQTASPESGELFSFEIFFQPNQHEFSANLYREQFDKVIDFSSTYGGAIITIEGHSDPMGYLRKKKEGETEVLLKKIEQAAKNLSLSRANSVRDELIQFARDKGITLDPSQFATVGHGIEKPVYALPQSDKEWLANMRVEFKIIQIEAEENVFKKL
ncbi:MAG: ABC transporter substrate-binding protein [Spirochaetales bacterium]|nr:ABC transporter substrate-binding protein [Spirochaetales bacterium]